MSAPPAQARTRRRLLLLPTLAGYQRSWLVYDLTAGLAAGAVVVPQAMAYATIANLPVQVGLYTCIIPMLVYALLGGSRAMSVSTTSTIATLTATTLVTAGVAAESEDAAGTLMALAMLVGLMLLAARLLRLGSLVENISAATVLGVKIGVGGTVAVGQLPKLLGEDVNPSGEGFFRAIAGAIEAFDRVSWPTVALSIGSVLVIVLCKRFVPRVPGTLVVVVVGIVLVWLTDIEDAGVALIDPIPAGLPVPGIPDLSHVVALIPGALAIAIMVFLESAAVARSIRRTSEPAIDADQELLAVGAANIAGAFFTVLPAAGGFSQSAVNQTAGARTQLATVVTVCLAILVALFLGPAVSLLPQATLAAMVLVAVAGLIDIPLLVRWARISPLDFWVALVVAVLGLTSGLLTAVAAGVVITLILVLRELNVPQLDIVAERGAVLIVLLGRGMYTANALSNERAIIDLVTSRPVPVRTLVLDVRRLSIMTITVLDTLADLDRELAAKGVTLHLAALPEKAVAVAARTAWYQGVASAGRVHTSAEEGLRATE
ncbi:SulP family inorganic anion transporter [Microbacterium abyssi]|uniref:SulP family inorganic anion transporter n=1 Tax=Microbacterium abyssi TaxID=2782166 RepID=UPI0018884F3E|nr:SulP family inorganic anion transporter [Microbacterium sp. A18JL241]